MIPETETETVTANPSHAGVTLHLSTDAETPERERIRYKQLYESTCLERDAYEHEKHQVSLKVYELELMLRQKEELIGALKELCSVYRHYAGWQPVPKRDTDPF